MTHDEGTFTGASGGQLYWQSWTPATPKAVVVLAHGLHEHSGRYAHVAQRLVDAGYAVHTLDHEGHGKSSGTKGNVGSMAGVLDDFDHVRRQAEAAHPGLPVFVLGHSMGGLIALDYLVSKGQQGLAGVAVSGPAVDTSSAGGVQLKLAPLVGRIAPNLGVLLLGSTNVSRDPAVVKDYEDDPLNHNGKVRARTGAEMLRLGAARRRRAPAGDAAGPGDARHRRPAWCPPQGSQLVEEKLGSSDKTLKLYDGLYHEIFNEPEKEQVLDDLVGWLDAHV